MAWETWRSTVVAVGVLGVVLVAVRPGAATTFFVEDLGDNGKSDQLRTLINAAEPGDTIVIPSGTITLTMGQLNITKNVSIQGAGPDMTVIDGGGIDRVFDIQTATTVSISGLTVQNGRKLDEFSGGGRHLERRQPLTEQRHRQRQPV